MRYVVEYNTAAIVSGIKQFTLLTLLNKFSKVIFKGHWSFGDSKEYRIVGKFGN